MDETYNAGCVMVGNVLGAVESDEVSGVCNQATDSVGNQLRHAALRTLRMRAILSLKDERATARSRKSASSQNRRRFEMELGTRNMLPVSLPLPLPQVITI